jgi:hypothetical protein
LIHVINPNYPFAESLVSTVLITANQQLFFASHLPSLTSLEPNENRYNRLYSFLENVVFCSINGDNKYA